MLTRCLSGSAARAYPTPIGVQGNDIGSVFTCHAIYLTPPLALDFGYPSVALSLWLDPPRSLPDAGRLWESSPSRGRSRRTPPPSTILAGSRGRSASWRYP